jgi:hypothetical protein
MAVLSIKRLRMDRREMGVEWVPNRLNGLVRMESEQRKTHPWANQIRKDGALYVFLDFDLIVRTE